MNHLNNVGKVKHLSYNEAIEKIYSLELLGIKLGLDNIKLLLTELGNPHKELNFIHIAGTNGKGSVSVTIAKALQSAGYKVGLQTSPHLISIRERFRIDGKGISEYEFAEVVSDIWGIIDKFYKQGIKITFFEATIALAFLFFKKNNCDFIVWETGLGGRFDATNVVLPIVSIITTIGYDHQKYLGDTLEKIAFEKAGIIKKSIPVFTGNIEESPLRIIEIKAKEENSPIFKFDKFCLDVYKKENMYGWYFKRKDIDNFPEFYYPVEGSPQIDNLKLSYTVLKFLSNKFSFSLNDSLAGLKNVKWPARSQILPDGRFLDGAHNPQGAKTLLETIKMLYPDKKFDIIYGCMEERNPRENLEILSVITNRVFFVPIVSSPKHLSPEKAVGFLAGFSKEVILCESLQYALKNTKPLETIITGSLYLSGEVLNLYFKEDEIINF